MKSTSREPTPLDSGIDWLLSLPDAERMATIETLTIPQRLALSEKLSEWRPLPHQREPDGDWFLWVMQWGAGSGKTYTGAQKVRERIDARTWRTVNVAGPTWVDTMRTMVHGSEDAPGLMGVWPPHQRPTLRGSKDYPHLRTHNGARINLFAAQKAERFRGPAGDGAWFDELDAWKPEGMTAAEAFALAEQRIRTGPDPRIFITSTPKRRGLIAQLSQRKSAVVTRATMYDNASNLAPSYVAKMREQYEGTRLGRQELLGEILPDVEGAIVSQDMIDAGRIAEPPDLLRIGVAVDPYGGGGDACGIVAGGQISAREFALLADATCKGKPMEWATRTIDVALAFDADFIVYEANYGGDMVESTLLHAMEARGIPRIRLIRVHATRGKHVRFEPVGAKYERGEMHHIGDFPELEDEVCQFTPDGFDGDGSPNRADALVWLVTHLFPAKRGLSFSDLHLAPAEATHGAR